MIIRRVNVPVLLQVLHQAIIEDLSGVHLTVDVTHWPLCYEGFRDIR